MELEVVRRVGVVGGGQITKDERVITRANTNTVPLRVFTHNRHRLHDCFSFMSYIISHGYRMNTMVSIL